MKKFLITTCVLSFLVLPVKAEAPHNPIGKVFYYIIETPLNVVDNILNFDFYKPWISKEDKEAQREAEREKQYNKNWNENQIKIQEELKARKIQEEAEILNDMRRQCIYAFKHNEDVQEFTQEMLQNDYISHYKQHEQKIDEYYQLFLKDKNNMKNNRILYDILDEKYKQYHKVHLDYNSTFSNTFLAECSSTVESGRQGFEEFLEKNPCELESINIYSAFHKNYKRISEIKDEIYKYSKTYEQNKYKEWAKRNNKKPLCGALEPYIYYPYASQPSIGCIYTAPPGSLPIYVFQTVPGGVILTGSTRVMAQYGFSLNNIFLQTSQHFANNQRIHSFMAEFKGYYDYTTVLGVRKRIYKFYRLGQKEIDANFTIPGQPFYFYQPY